MTTRDDWQAAQLDLRGYLERLGLDARTPSRAALDELVEQHVRTFTFDNVDVLLGQHPGVGLEAVQGKFVGRGRGGYCFEHSTILAAALERLGYPVVRRLARVGDPAAVPVSGRTHLVVEVVLDGQRLLCDPGFGMGLVRPVPLVDGHVAEQGGGWRFRVTRDGDRAVWRLARARGHGWEPMHSTDEHPVVPQDVEIGHHYTSTYPGSHFTQGLVVARHLPGRHVTVTESAVTVRRPGSPTEHRDLAAGELREWLELLAPSLTEDEVSRLLARSGVSEAMPS
ncbi:arylamine N-acetyltransferase family protein [Isoptericola cucumis]|uniref:Arylamine N-acetyltransferase n=1 Tax=Isoptericola cucumis TaxID=1776856 RepID=A0ABQ2BDK8_9MICO|nr:arylamine N-acetyltransferase [Isoptericola cucumis]GGI11708.1 arylamine N-acetyltransferase [Isoptericola cucumis]